MQTELSLVLEKTLNKQTKNGITGAGIAARHTGDVTCCWDQCKLDIRKESQDQDLSFHGECWPVVFLTCFAAFLSETYIPCFRMPRAWGEFGAFPSLSLFPLRVLSIPQPLLVLYLFFLIYFLFPSLSLPSFFFFVKPSSFKITKRFFFLDEGIIH